MKHSRSVSIEMDQKTKSFKENNKLSINRILTANNSNSKSKLNKMIMIMIINIVKQKTMIITRKEKSNQDRKK
jgi:hypothetical protein